MVNKVEQQDRMKGNGPCLIQKNPLKFRFKQLLPWRKAGPSSGDMGYFYVQFAMKMAIQTFTLNLLILKLWQLIEAYAKFCDYFLSHHISIELEHA